MDIATSRGRVKMTAEAQAEFEASRNPPAEPPQQILMYQAHLALIERDLMDRVEQILNGMPAKDGRKARTYFYQSPTMKRQHPLVLQLMPQIPLTPAEVDELFVFANANF